MLSVRFTSSFKKDYKRLTKQDPRIEKELQLVLAILSKGGTLPSQYRDHALHDTRLYKKVRECHIRPDLLLVYKVIEKSLVLELIRLGSHSELKL